MPKKGDVLKSVTPKVKDRCYLSPGVVVNGYDRPQPIKATVLQSQQFDGKTYYLVLLDGEKPPGRWYAASGVTIKQGKLQPVRPEKQAKVKVTSPDGKYEASFLLDQNGVDSYIAEGFTVVVDDDKLPS